MSTAKKYLGFDDKWLMIVGIPLVSLIFSSVIFAGALSVDRTYFFALCLPVSLLYTGTYWLVFRSILIQLRKRFELRHDVVKRVTIETLLVLVVFFLLKPLLAWVEGLSTGIHNSTFRPDPTIEVFASLLFTFLILAIYEIIFIYRQLEASNLDKAELARVHAERQLEGLRSQIQPHFLFNSLNTLAGLIPIDEERAIKYVQKLSKVFRYVLEIDNEPLISVRRELDFLHSYVYLMKERFADNLQVDINVPKEYLNHMIVPLSLQILFENAIKHNSFSREDPLKISISVNEQDRIVVENNLRKKEVPESTTKVGLDNIKNRYRFFGDEGVEIKSGVETFVVTLPLISNCRWVGTV